MLRSSGANGWPFVKDVGFQFSAHENLTQNVTRLLSGQIQHAIYCLNIEIDPEEAVHACRLATKRIDAVLLLLGERPGVKTLQKQTKLVQKALSKYRDTTVLRDHVSALPTSKTRRRALAHLDAQRVDVYDEFCHKTKPVMLEQLELMLSMAKRITVPDKFSSFGPGMMETYSKARVGVARLSSALPKAAKQLHKWRTQVKRHGYHLELMLPCAPLYIEPRLLAVNHIGHCLGEYHDLELTRREVSKPKVRRRIESQQRGLLTDALALQRWAMQPKPGKFIGELEQRWDLWHKT